MHMVKLRFLAFGVAMMILPLAHAGARREFRGKGVVQYLRHRELAASARVGERQKHHRHAECQEPQFDHVHAFRDV